MFVHWGLYSIPAFAERTNGDVAGYMHDLTAMKDTAGETPYAERYLNALRVPGSSTARHHEATNGPGFSYLDFRRQFDADTERLGFTTIALYRHAGRVYFGHRRPPLIDLDGRDAAARGNNRVGEPERRVAVRGAELKHATGAQRAHEDGEHPRRLGLDVPQALASVLQLGIVLPAVPEELLQEPLQLPVHLVFATGSSLGGQGCARACRGSGSTGPRRRRPLRSRAPRPSARGRPIVEDQARLSLTSAGRCRTPRSAAWRPQPMSAFATRSAPTSSTGTDGALPPASPWTVASAASSSMSAVSPSSQAAMKRELDWPPPGGRLQLDRWELPRGGSTSMLHAGFDLSGKRLDFHLLDEAGETVEVGAACLVAEGLRGLRLDRRPHRLAVAIDALGHDRFAL